MLFEKSKRTRAENMKVSENGEKNKVYVCACAQNKTHSKRMLWGYFSEFNTVRYSVWLWWGFTV